MINMRLMNKLNGSSFLLSFCVRWQRFNWWIYITEKGWTINTWCFNNIRLTVRVLLTACSVCASIIGMSASLWRSSMPVTSFHWTTTDWATPLLLSSYSPKESFNVQNNRHTYKKPPSIRSSMNASSCKYNKVTYVTSTLADGPSSTFRSSTLKNLST